MRQKHNKGAEQENKNIKQKNTLENTKSYNAREERKDNKFLEKTSMKEICLMCGGKLFQAQGAATENARSPSVEWVRGTAKDSDCADLRPALLLAMEIGTTSSAR